MAKNLAGRSIDVIAIPQPDPVFESGVRLPASYINFYIANEVVLVPVFQCDKDQIALAILESLFPKHCVVGINALALLQGYGGIHCVTQQQPLTEWRDTP